MPVGLAREEFDASGRLHARWGAHGGAWRTIVTDGATSREPPISTHGRTPALTWRERETLEKPQNWPKTSQLGPARRRKPPVWVSSFGD